MLEWMVMRAIKKDLYVDAMRLRASLGCGGRGFIEDFLPEHL